MSGGFFRGTSADQDTRFSNKQAKLLKSQKFAPELEHLVDMTKVKMDVFRPWIATRVTELLGFEDEVLINFVYGLLEGKEADGKQIQIQLTGFMEKNTGKFMKELWGLLLSAQKNASGVPQQFLDAKEQELKKKQHETDRIGLEGRRRERGGWGPEPDKTRLDGEADIVAAVDGSRSVTLTAVSSIKQSSVEDGSPRSDDDVRMDCRHGSRRKRRHSTSAHSDDNSLSSNRRSPSASGSRSRSLSNSRSLSEERHRSRSVSVSPRHRRRSVSPERRYPSPRHHGSPRRAPRSPFRRQSPHYKRRSTSRPRYRSPLVRHRSPLRRRSPQLRHRSPSPFRHRSPSPYRYRSPSPRRRQSPRRRSPVNVRRRSPSPPRRSPIRRRTPPRHISPRKRGSPPSRSPRYHRRSPAAAAAVKRSGSPRRSQSPHRSHPNRSPVPSEKPRGLDLNHKRHDSSVRKQSTMRLPDHKSRERSGIQNVESVKPASPEMSKPCFGDRDKKPNEKRVHESSLSPDRHPKERSVRDGSDASEVEAIASRHYQKHKVDSSHNNFSHSSLDSRPGKVVEEIPQPKDNSRGRLTLNQLDERKGRSLHRNATDNAMSQREHHIRSNSNSPQDVEYGPGIIGGGSLPSDAGCDSRTFAKKYSFEVGRPSNGLKGSDSVSDDDKIPALHRADDDSYRGFDKKIKRKVDQHNSDSNSEDDKFDKGPLVGQKSNRKDTSDDESGYQSDSIDRKDRKRRRKEEKRLRKEEKRRRQEERHRRKEERRAAKQKAKHMDTQPPSDDDHSHVRSDSEVERERKSSDKEDTESEQKKLEIRLREKALESLRAKKAIAN